MGKGIGRRPILRERTPSRPCSSANSWELAGYANRSGGGTTANARSRSDSIRDLGAAKSKTMVCDGAVRRPDAYACVSLGIPVELLLTCFPEYLVHVRIMFAREKPPLLHVLVRSDQNTFPQAHTCGAALKDGTGGF